MRNKLLIVLRLERFRSPGHAARMMLRRSGFRGFQIGFESYNSWNPGCKRSLEKTTENPDGVGIPSGEEAWKNHPQNPNEKLVHTLEAQTENERDYFSNHHARRQTRCKSVQRL